MDRDTTDRREIVIPMLSSIEDASVEVLDEQLLLLEAARNRLDMEWTETLGAFEERTGS